MTVEAESLADGVSRRSVLKRGAVLGAAAVWTVPVVQAVGMTSAHAESPSGTIIENPPVPPVQPPATTPTGTTALPDTGARVPIAPVVAAGTAALAVGAGIVAIARAGNTDTEGDDPVEG